MKIHLIACGGAIMHNIMIALHKAGNDVSGSDDAIYEPAKSRLEKHGILPVEMGWEENKINQDLEMVILGMHAKKDNPELIKAQGLGLNVVSFPEMLYDFSKNKLRVAVCGSHGKTTITSMVMHVLKNQNKNFDYAVGSMVEGFEDSVRLSNGTDLIILEGDEYLSSPIDLEPKFMHYHPKILLINGLEWDHKNVFPTYEIYLEQFRKLLKSTDEHTKIIYNCSDNFVKEFVENEFKKGSLIPANLPTYFISDEKVKIENKGRIYSLSIFGKHNLANLSGALEICKLLGIYESDFFMAISSFKGAAKRLEKIHDKEGLLIFRDFAHAPSKAIATVEAVREQYVEKKITAILELHTFSSLQPDFIANYKDSLSKADVKIVFISKVVQKEKVNFEINEKFIQESFNDISIQFIQEKEDLKSIFEIAKRDKGVILLMSSGNFDGMEL